MHILHEEKIEKTSHINQTSKDPEKEQSKARMEVVKVILTVLCTQIFIQQKTLVATGLSRLLNYPYIRHQFLRQKRHQD